MPTTHKTRVLIIGAGPAGYTAAIYAARASLAPIMVAGLQPGGQLMITTDVENYPGFSAIPGPELMTRMAGQAEHVGTTIVQDVVVSVDFALRPFRATGDSGDVYEADSVIIATGAQARWLGLPSEAALQGFGVSACATCDGFFFRGKRVAVVGGGNTAVEEALHLTHHADLCADWTEQYQPRRVRFDPDWRVCDLPDGRGPRRPQSSEQADGRDPDARAEHGCICGG